MPSKNPILKLRVIPSKNKAVRAAAQRAGQKINHWLNDAIDAKLKKETDENN